MSARDVIARAVATTKRPSTGELMVGRGARKRADAILSALRAAGWSVVKVPDEVDASGNPIDGDTFDDGWNACRAATLESEDKP